MQKNQPMVRIFFVLSLNLACNPGTIPRLQAEHSLQALQALQGSSRLPFRADPPPQGRIVMPAEFARSGRVLINVPAYDMAVEAYGETGYQELNAYYRKVVAAAIAAGVTPHILVPNADETQRIAAEILQPQNLTAESVRFDEATYDSIWTRDYGPWSICVNGKPTLVDNRYFPNRKRDDEVSSKLGERWNQAVVHSPLFTEGGNFMTDGRGLCLASKGVFFQNRVYRPDIDAFEPMSQAMIEALYKNYFGCKTSVFIGSLPGESTQHIDMFTKFLNERTVAIASSTPALGARSEEIAALDQAASLFASLKTFDGGDWKIVRMPMRFSDEADKRIYYTYTNSLILNDSVLVPTYGLASDSEALALYQEAMPAHTIGGIDASTLIRYGGAIHCSTMQMPVNSCD